MCCLFGILDYKNSLSDRQKRQILSVLSIACEVRGTDASGIAYRSGNQLCMESSERKVKPHRGIPGLPFYGSGYFPYRGW